MTSGMRPDRSEYEVYYGRYIDLVPEGDIIASLGEQVVSTVHLLKEVSEEQGNYRYGEGKWSIKEVVGHMIDTERVFAFRALAFSRNDRNPFPGMEQDDWARGANYGDRPLRDILEEFRSVRDSTIRLARSFSEAMWLRKGTASGCEFSVRSAVYIIAGHELHHVRIIRDRYL